MTRLGDFFVTLATFESSNAFLGAKNWRSYHFTFDNNWVNLLLEWPELGHSCKNWASASGHTARLEGQIDLSVKGLGIV